MQTLYTAIATSTGGRDGRAVSSDNILDVKLATPKELGGAGGAATNPEQLFAAGYSACFIGALKFVASQTKRKIPDDASITAHVGIGQIPGGFGLDIDLHISLPGLEQADAQALATAARSRGVPLKVLPLDRPENLYRSKLVLVRPDQHIAWRGRRVAELVPALRRAVGLRD